MDLFRAGETPELRTWGMLVTLESPHGVRLRFQLSVSDDATSEPDPVLPSIGSEGPPINALFSGEMVGSVSLILNQGSYLWAVSYL